MAETKSLILMVETSAALAPHWPTIFSDYLEKVIRSFCGDDNTKPDSPIEMAILTFTSRGRFNCLVNRRPWMKNVDYFMESLTRIKFPDDGYSDSAITEGLAEAVRVLHSIQYIQNHQSPDLQKHCILIAASNPFPLPPTERHSSDAVKIAKFFKKYLISLSVICPTELPKLKAIYNEGNRNPNAINPTVDKNPDYMVLISEGFMEARVALIRQPEITKLPSNQSPVLIDSSSSTSAGNIPPATETSTVSSMASVSSSSLSTSQEMTTSMNDDAVVTGDMTPSIPVDQTVTSTGQAESATLPGTSTGPTTRMQSLNADVATIVGPAGEPPEFVKIWEGDLITEKEGQPVVITKLEAYRKWEDSESLANDWPSTMHIDRVLTKEVKNEIYGGDVEYVCFNALKEHEHLTQMHEQKLYSVVKLPSQTLVLFSEKYTCLLVGELYPQDMSSEEGVGGEQMEIDN